MVAESVPDFSDLFRSRHEEARTRAVAAVPVKPDTANAISAEYSGRSMIFIELEASGSRVVVYGVHNRLSPKEFVDVRIDIATSTAHPDG